MSLTKATIRPDESGTHRVFVGHWAFPHMDFGHHELSKAKRIKWLFDNGHLDAAMELARDE